MANMAGLGWIITPRFTNEAAQVRDCPRPHSLEIIEPGFKPDSEPLHCTVLGAVAPEPPETPSFRGSQLTAYVLPRISITSISNLDINTAMQITVCTMYFIVL